MVNIGGNGDGNRFSWDEERVGDMRRVGGVMIIVSGECVECVRCDQYYGYCVNFVSNVRQAGVVACIIHADGRSFCTEFMVDVGFVGVGCCFGVWGVSIAVDSRVGWSLAGNGFSFVVLHLYMRI